jgi:D-tyrosyl-tRNA(Tyr) deacylase
MKAVVQVVDSAKVMVDSAIVGAVNKGFLVLLGVHENDTEKEAELLAKKVANLRVFCDENDKMNLSAIDIGGEILTVSNFTLMADTKKGNRPSFVNAKAPLEADRLYMYFIEMLQQEGIKKTAHGQFGADMQISTELSGPVTIILDTDNWSTNK